MPDIGDWLGTRTFFTELELASTLSAHMAGGPHAEQYPERELRAQLLAQAARFGHPSIYLYAMVVNRLGTLSLGQQEADDADADARRAGDYLDVLDRQRGQPVGERGDWGPSMNWRRSLSSMISFLPPTSHTCGIPAR